MSYQAQPSTGRGADDVVVGVDLGDADASLSVLGGNLYMMPTSVALTANRTITLSTSGAAAKEMITIQRRDASAFTLTIQDDAATQLYVFAGGTAHREAGFQFDGTHFGLVGYVRLQ